MRHAILGAGGIGGLLGAALARAGADVVLLVRPETLARQPDRIVVDSAVLGNFEANVPVASLLDRPVDALWVTVKATELESALALAPPDAGIPTPATDELASLVIRRDLVRAEPG